MNKKNPTRRATRGKVFILSGPSGSGKTTLYKRLLLNRKFKKCLVKSISITTRSRRQGEQAGRDYIFVNPKMFLNRVSRGQFLEWQKVFDQYYGTPKKPVLDWLKLGKNVLLCIDVKGARDISQLKCLTVRIFIKPPSLKVLKQRLAKRGSEGKEDLYRRLETARGELKEAKSYDYIVTNDNISQALKKLEEIICSEMKSPHG